MMFRRWFVLLWMVCPVVLAETLSFTLEFKEPVAVKELLEGYGPMKVQQLGDLPVYCVTADISRGERAYERALQSLPGLVRMEVNRKMQGLRPDPGLESRSVVSNILDEVGEIDNRTISILDDEVDEDYFPIYSQDFVQQVRAIEAWPHSTGWGVWVAVLDTGIDEYHEFIEPNVLWYYEYDFVDDDYYPDDLRTGLDSNGNGIPDEGYGHGTHVAGVIKTIAPHVSILPLRVVDSDGQADTFHIVQAIYHALYLDVDIINLSLSIEEPTALLQDFIDLATDMDVVVITSAGNENANALRFPANLPEVISVASVDSQLAKSSFSNFHPDVDLAAPGEAIISCIPGDLYQYRSGTSMAAPIVAGQAAIILELIPNKGRRYVFRRVTEFSRNIDDYNPLYQGQLGQGFVDIWDSITVDHLNP